MSSIWNDIRHSEKHRTALFGSVLLLMCGLGFYIMGHIGPAVMVVVAGLLLAIGVVVELKFLRPFRTFRQLRKSRADQLSDSADDAAGVTSRATRSLGKEIVGLAQPGANHTVYASAQPGISPQLQSSLLTTFTRQIRIASQAAKGGEAKTTLLVSTALAHATARVMSVLVLDTNPKGNLELKLPVLAQSIIGTIIDLADACTKGSVNTQADFARYATIIDGCYFVRKPNLDQRELTVKDIDAIMESSVKASFPFVYLDNTNVIKGANERVMEIADIILMPVTTKGEAKNLAREDVASILKLYPDKHLLVVAVEKSRSTPVEILKTMGEFRWPEPYSREDQANGKPDLRAIFEKKRPKGLHVRLLSHHEEIADGRPLWWYDLPSSLKTQVRDIIASALTLAANGDVPYQPSDKMFDMLPVPPAVAEDGGVKAAGATPAATSTEAKKAARPAPEDTAPDSSEQSSAPQSATQLAPREEPEPVEAVVTESGSAQITTEVPLTKDQSTATSGSSLIEPDAFPAAPASTEAEPSGVQVVDTEHVVSTSPDVPEPAPFRAPGDENHSEDQVLPSHVTVEGAESLEQVAVRLWPALEGDEEAIAVAAESLYRLNAEAMGHDRQNLFSGDMLLVPTVAV